VKNNSGWLQTPGTFISDSYNGSLSIF